MIFPAIFFSLFILLASGNGETRQATLEHKIAAYHLHKKDIEIYIDKTRHMLTLRIGVVDIRRYRCVFGADPVSDKKYEGDGCTPEGEFHIIAMHTHPHWDKFMLLDYPTAESREKFAINKAHGKIPPHATIGSAIGIHGVPYNKPYLIERGINWTLGCISLSNPDIEEIYNNVSVGTRVVIVK